MKMEDVDIMEGIDFKANKIRRRKQERKARIIENIKVLILMVGFTLALMLLNYIEVCL